MTMTTVTDLGYLFSEKVVKEMSQNYVVFGGPRSLFTRKLTAALDFYEADYSIVDRSPWRNRSDRRRSSG